MEKSLADNDSSSLFSLMIRLPGSLKFNGTIVYLKFELHYQYSFLIQIVAFFAQFVLAL